METIRIPNEATYLPFALTDVAVAAPLLTRIALGATLPGQLIQAAALTMYAGSAIQDWVARFGIRPIHFTREFGADLNHLEVMPADVRIVETRTLTERLNDEFTNERPALRELAVDVDRHLTDYIAGITSQRIETSREVRTASLVQYVFPFALGAADIFSGDVSIFHDTGVFQPHVVAHEFCHRKGYWRELDAQALAYLALASSGEPALVQSALAERLMRDVRVLTGDDDDAYDAAIRALGLRSELEKDFIGRRIDPGPIEKQFADVMKKLYDARMRMTGQNGLSDYDLGFTNFLYSFERSGTARQRPPVRGALR